jgi:hypothetical protein
LAVLVRGSDNGEMEQTKSMGINSSLRGLWT